MPLNKTELAMLRKQYPAEHFDIKEQGSKLEVVPKKCVIRMFTHNIHRINNSFLLDGDSFGDALLRRIETIKLEPKAFEQRQITVEKRVSDKLTAEAKKCKTRKIIYLQQLLGGNSK